MPRSDVRDWIGFLAWERGLSPRTREAYASDLRALAAFLAGDGAAGPAADPDRVDWRAVGTERLRGFLEEGVRAGLSEATRARRLVAVKGFFAYLRAEGRIDADPAAGLAQARRSRVLPHALSEGAVARFFEGGAPGRETLRDRALLELLYGCGLRESEAAGLTLDEVRLDEALVRVRGKGGKVRQVPLGSRAEAAVRAYLGPEGRPRFRPAPGEPRLLLNRFGRGMSRHAVWDVVKARAAAAGLPRDVSPHWLRHSFATHLMAHGAPVRAIQEMLGHADVGTTQIYTHVDAGRLASVVRSSHPRGAAR